MNVLARALVLACAIVALFVGPHAARAADEPAPGFTAVDVAGVAISLESFKDKKHVVLVFYWNHG